MSIEKTACGFCGSDAKLRESHIIPSFVFRWLKETSGTGYMRSSQNPNKRVQDGFKLKLLCHECESRFNRWETAFATKIFHPFNADHAVSVNYDDWMIKYCVSVSWRALTMLKRLGRTDQLSEARRLAVDQALATWRSFMLGEVPHPGRFEQHLLPLPGISEENLPDMPQNINRYLLRGAELDFCVLEKSDHCMVMAKFGPFMLFGHVIPPVQKWKGTRVSVTHGRFAPGRYKLPAPMWGYITSRARRHHEVIMAVSEVQFQKINDQIQANIGKFKESSLFDAIMMDHDMFGPNAIVRKSK